MDHKIRKEAIARAQYNLSLNKLEDVVNVDAVTGPYDIISIVSCTDLAAVGELVTNDIHTIQGIVRTVTCLSL